MADWLASSTYLEIPEKCLKLFACWIAQQLKCILQVERKNLNWDLLRVNKKEPTLMHLCVCVQTCDYLVSHPHSISCWCMCLCISTFISFYGEKRVFAVINECEMLKRNIVFVPMNYDRKWQKCTIYFLFLFSEILLKRDNIQVFCL